MNVLCYSVSPWAVFWADKEYFVYISDAEWSITWHAGKKNRGDILSKERYDNDARLQLALSNPTWFPAFFEAWSLCRSLTSFVLFIPSSLVSPEAWSRQIISSDHPRWHWFDWTLTSALLLLRGDGPPSQKLFPSLTDTCWWTWTTVSDRSTMSWDKEITSMQRNLSFHPQVQRHPSEPETKPRTILKILLILWSMTFDPPLAGMDIERWTKTSTALSLRFCYSYWFKDNMKSNWPNSLRF